MLENLQTVGLLTFMEIVGPLLLGAAIAYAIWRTRRRSRRQQAATDQASRRLYQEGARQEREEGL
jgi:NhaP-type Na+/H+ or K+/H+ antiporter